jgi:hypothetical protein
MQFGRLKRSEFIAPLSGAGVAIRHASADA